MINSSPIPQMKFMNKKLLFNFNLLFSCFLLFMHQSNLISWQQYSKHITPQDCWILVEGFLYDVSDYMVEHPGGDDILIKYSGIDATIPFTQQQHSAYAISLRNARRVGKIQTPVYTQQYRLMIQQKKKGLRQKQKSKSFRQTKAIRQNIPLEQISQHSSQKSCWVVIQDKVYDVTDYLPSHPGGEGLILDKAGKDATTAFNEANHSIYAIQKREQFLIGRTQNSNKARGISSLILIVLMITLALTVGWLVLGSFSTPSQ